ncbi:MAG TPA: sensor histidine kinase [Bacilli bacterium]
MGDNFQKIINNLVKLYKNLMLREKIAIFFSLMAIVLLVIQGSIIYSFSVGVIEKEMENGAKQTIEQVSLNIDSYFDLIKTITTITANNQTLIDTVENYFSSYVDQLDYNKNLQNILSQYTYMIPYIDNLIVVKNGKSIYDKNNSIRKDFDFNKEDWFTNHVGHLIRVAFVGPHRHNYYYDHPPSTYVISAIIPVRDPLKGSKENAGALIFDIDINKINSIFDQLNLDRSQDIYILDSSGSIIAYKDDRLIATKFKADYLSHIIKNDKGTYIDRKGDQNLLVVYSTSAITGWKTVIATKMTNIGQVAESVRNTTVFTIIAAIFIAMAISIFISSKVTKSIFKLKNRMDQVSMGNYHSGVKVENNDEVGMLSRHFNKMVEELKKLINENYIVKIKQKEAELSALQAKINPHFLNNTLQSIHSMAVLNKTKDIENTIESLGKLFDYVLYESGETVLIRDEIRYLESYLQIQESRNSRRYEYKIDADKQIEHYKIPKLMLQPLVENALIHGLKMKLSGGLVKVSVHEEDDFVTFIVSDNGQGMSPEELERVNERLDQEQTHTKSMGLKNVYERIKLRYGEQGSFQIQTKQEEGTSIMIKISKSCML